MKDKKKIVVFSGAGLDRESGVKTFRDNEDSLWENYNIDDVCTPNGWRKDPQLVTDFYNERRMELANVEPNDAHIALANLERIADVVHITQNVTDLLERGGSTFVHHLHGELGKVRSVADANEIYDYGTKPVHLEEDRAKHNARLRPHIVWFGEMPDVKSVKKAYKVIYECDVLLIVGTSLQISYTLDMLMQASLTCEVYFIDPNPVKYLDRYTDLGMMPNITYIKKNATDGVTEIVNRLLEQDESEEGN